MPSIKRTVAAVTANALQDLRFTQIPNIAVINLFATTATGGEILSFGAGEDAVIAEDLVVNLEVRSQTVVVPDDQLLFNEPVRGGQLRLSVPAVAADMTYLLHIALP